jgi:uncharacterized protein YcaQ
MADLSISLADARRLAITRQRLAGPRAAATREGMLDVIRDLGYVQLDPISVVARSHLLVLWSRLGTFDRAELAALQWEDRAAFEYWAHGASIVPTEDYPLHHLRMRRYPTDRSVHGRRTRAWLAQNTALRRHVLSRLRRAGPLRLRDFEDRAVVGWKSSGWTAGRNVERMLDVLWTQGRVMVAGRSGVDRVWDLADRWLPSWTPRDRLSEWEILRRTAERSLRALGVASPRQVRDHFSVGRYPSLDGVLQELQREGRIVPATIVANDGELPGPWFVHGEDLSWVDRLAAGDWEPRTTLLSPFDNLIIERDRTEMLFGFRFRMEIYVPKDQRIHGYYVLPVLYGDRLIGRMDLRMDQHAGVLRVNAVHPEQGAPSNRTTGRAVQGSIDDLARFLGARNVTIDTTTREGWARWLR